MTAFVADIHRCCHCRAGKGTWSVGRCAAAEAALTGSRLRPEALVGALRGVAQQGLDGAQGSGGARTHPLACQLAEGMLLTALAPLVEQVSGM